MKKLMISLLALMLIAGVAQAQMKMEFGFKGAVNMSNVTGDVENNKMMLGFGGGIFGKFMPSPQFTIQPEVLYMMKGAKYDDHTDEFGCEITDGKLVLNYVEVDKITTLD